VFRRNTYLYKFKHGGMAPIKFVFTSATGARNKDFCKEKELPATWSYIELSPVCKIGAKYMNV